METPSSQIDYFHLGYRCIPSYLINKVLGYPDKSPFADVRIGLVDAAQILARQFEGFLDQKQLTFKGGKAIGGFDSEVEKLVECRGHPIFHAAYPSLRFRHQFGVRAGRVRNYAFVRAHYDALVEEFYRKMSASDRPGVFVHF
uniref:Uncharacterized protein n=1 Tax=Lotharella oceanica TaxID=641309 RepID=A0A7S2TXH1_9EUKA